MGPSGMSLSQKLAQKDEQIASLESRIQAYTLRTTHIHTRLLSTLDTLDAIQATHAQEMSAVVKGKKRAEEALKRYVGVVRSAEVERDDMRDAVMKLVEKVQVSNDYSAWPHSRMQLLSLADFSLPFHPTRPTNTNEDEAELLNYASQIIQSLRHERDAERKAHERTREMCEARMCALEAKLCRREAELEVCLRDGVGMTLRDGVSAPRLMHNQSEAPFQMTDDEAIQMLEMTATRNRELEVEIRDLFRRLNEARSSTSPPPRFPPSQEKQSSEAAKRRPPLDDTTSSADERANRPASRGQTTIRPTVPGDETMRPTSPGQMTIRPTSPGDITIRLQTGEQGTSRLLTDDATLPNEIAVISTMVEALSNPRPTSTDHEAINNQRPTTADERAPPENNHLQHLRETQPIPSPRPPTGNKTHLALITEDLDRQIALLGETVEVFRRERDELWRVVEGEKRKREGEQGKGEEEEEKESVEPPTERKEPVNREEAGPSIDPSDRIAALEEECTRSGATLRSVAKSEEVPKGSTTHTIDRLAALEEECSRLRQSEETLRAEIARTKARENELLDEIYALRRQLSEAAFSEGLLQPRSRTSPPLPQRDQRNPSLQNHPHLLEPDEGEVSMELATPLIPTSAIAALPRSRSHSRSPRIMGYDDHNDNDEMPRVTGHNDNANFVFDNPPSFLPPLSPPTGYLMRREGRDSPSTTGHSSSAFPNMSLSAFPMPPSSSAVALPPSFADHLLPSLSRTSRGWELASEQQEIGERGEDIEREHASGEDRELDGLQDMLGEAGIALSEVRDRLEKWDRT